jgi:hypothetical protein
VEVLSISKMNVPDLGTKTELREIGRPSRENERPPGATAVVEAVETVEVVEMVTIVGATKAVVAPTRTQRMTPATLIPDVAEAVVAVVAVVAEAEAGEAHHLVPHPAPHLPHSQLPASTLTVNQFH